MAARAASERMSEYELARQERIKENQKMLEELFPEGTTDLTPPKPKRRHTDANSLGSGSDCVSETSHSDEEGLLTTKAKHRSQLSKIYVYPRRNPSRKARPVMNLDEANFRMTRSATRANNEGLVDGLEGDQELKRAVYRTIRRRTSTDDDLPIELDDVPALPSTKRIKVLEKSSDKIYDRVRGTTCHQCRQKTIDAKTLCHNKNCRGVRGQFCAPCLLNRYGEGLIESLRNKEWVCPPCRKICNCSFCMPKRGKPPTGILIHHARDAGCDSVHEYLNRTNFDY